MNYFQQLLDMVSNVNVVMYRKSVSGASWTLEEEWELQDMMLEERQLLALALELEMKK